MTKTSEFVRALENAIDELKEKGYTDDDVILDCEGNEITQNEIVCSLLAEQVVEALEKRQGYKVACLEEIAMNNSWLSKEQVLAIGQTMSKNGYGQYLISLVG